MLYWNNKNIPQPTQEELETAWIEVEKELKEQERQANIRKDIAEAFIEFK
jgi:hypothetical protein